MNRRQVIKKISEQSAPSDQTVRSGEELARVFVPENGTVPIVECFKDGDVIQYIDIRCGCGQTTRLICEYPATSKDRDACGSAATSAS